ncbi:MAG: RHS repeat domain-containing protein [Bacillota bacterium]
MAETDELGHTIRTEYDALGRVMVSKAPFEAGKERVIRNYYDAAGNITSTVDPEGGVTNYQYNSRNLLTLVEKVINSWESDFVKYAYDAKGNRTKVAAGLSSPQASARAETMFAYDSLNRIISFTDPSGKSETYRYDANGNLLSSTDRNGRTCQYAYDGLNRIVKKQIIFNGRPETVEYSYDLLGNRTQMKDARGVTSYEYDSLSRLSKIRQDNGISLAYAYDILDRKVGMTLSQSADKLLDIQYSYNNLGLLTQVREQGRTLRYQYDPTSRLTTAINEVTGVTTNYSYNAGGMLTDLVNRQGDNLLSSFTYTYDLRGNQISKADQNGTSLYHYDALSRLKTALLPGNLTQHYTYDNLGNLTELIENQDGQIKETAYQYNRNSQLLLQEERAGDETTRCLFTYDANVNQTEKNKLVYRSDSLVTAENSSYSFDDWNRLREVITPEGQRVRYDYHGNNLRASKDVDGEITNFTHDGNNLILETDGRGRPRARNFYGRGLVSRQTAADVCYYLFNGHGDVTQLLNQRGEIVKDYDYDPFGKERTDQPQLIPGQLPVSLWRAEAEQPDNPFRYAGEYLDQKTGYYYLKARYYDPQIQRFISGDSLAKSPGWTEHSYAYVNYNPINYVDPTGHFAYTADFINRYDYDYVTGSDYDNQDFNDLVASWWSSYFMQTASESAGTSSSIPVYYGRVAGDSYGSSNNRASAYPVVVAGVYDSGSSSISNPIQLASNKTTPEWAPPLEKGDNDTIYPIPWYEDPIIAVITAPAKAAITIGRAAAKAVGTGISKGITKGAGTRFSPINPGPLSDDVAKTFTGGSYTQKVLTEDTTFYRVYGGKAGKVGSYMSRIPQNGGMQSQIDLALNPAWGNTASSVTKVTVPKGTVIYEGTAAPQVINGGAGSLLGGGNQVYIPRGALNPSWFGN